VFKHFKFVLSPLLKNASWRESAASTIKINHKTSIHIAKLIGEVLQIVIFVTKVILTT
jgi:hypothetical protein